MTSTRLIDLSGTCAVVTGGSRGVGRATARLLARAGASVGVGYRRREEEALETVEELLGYGIHAWAQAADLSKADQVEMFFDRVDREFEGLDVFVGNAGIWPPAGVAFERLTDAQWEETLSVNLTSAFYTARAAARRLRPGGSLVLVSSTAAQRGEAFHCDYAASKGAMNAMVKGLCVELGPRDVTVNAVAPGWIDTEMSESAFEGSGREAIEASVPLRRIASAEDVAGPILFLCSSLARHVTGEILNVNGGTVLSG